MRGSRCRQRPRLLSDWISRRTAAMDNKSTDPTTDPPIVVNLGKKTKKAIKKLKRGEGKMVAELALAMEEVRARLPEADKGKQLVPIVMFCERKAAKSKLPFSPLSFMK